jgi:ketosteroid isomerase-like protein
MKQKRPSDLERIEELRKKDIAASKAYDFEVLASLWDENGVALAPRQPPVMGMKAIRSRMLQRPSQANPPQVLDYDEKFEETVICGDYAFEWGHISGSERTRPGGPVEHSRVKVVRILKRQTDGSWRIRLSMFNDAEPR